MNKKDYKLAYEYIYNLINLDDESMKWPLTIDSMNIFKELVDEKLNKPTVEEIIKKWEEKGWKWETKGGVYYVSNKDNDDIEFCQKRKGCIFCGEIGISIELIELIHKTLNALEVENE